MPIPSPFSPKWALLIGGLFLLVMASICFLLGIVIVREGKDRAFRFVMVTVSGAFIVVSLLMMRSAFSAPETAETPFLLHLSPAEFKARAKTEEERQDADARLEEASAIAATLTPRDRATLEHVKAELVAAPTREKMSAVLESRRGRAPELANQKLRPVAFAVRPAPAARYAKGVLLGTLAWCGFLISLPATLVLGQLGGPLLSRALALRRRARRYRLDPRSALSGETRDPILYLRSFPDDYDERLEGFFANTYEQRLVAFYSRYGPVVAVGRPAEELPLLGALRLYFDDRTWQAGVLYLMSVAQAVIIHAGIAPSLLWELGAARQRLEPQRLIISFVEWCDLNGWQRRAQYLRFRKYAQELLGCELPARVEVSSHVTFDADWNPLVWEGKNRLPPFLSSRGWGLKFPPVAVGEGRGPGR